MRILACSLFLWIVLAAPIMARNAQPGGPAILAPRPGEVLQGVVTVSGTSAVNDFASAEIAFTYTDDTTGTWFPIAMNSQPVFNDTLATWDTTVITDGDYVLRLRITLTDGSSRDFFASDLRVRNYTPVETPTAMVMTPESTALPTFVPTATPLPRPTALPRNPAALAPADVSASILFGGLAAILVLILIGIYLRLRRK